MSLADHILGMVWLFPRGDSRKDEVRAVAEQVRALEDALKCDAGGHHGLRAVMDGRGSWCCQCGTMFVIRGEL